MVYLAHQAYKKRNKAAWKAFLKSVYGANPICQVCGLALDFDADNTLNQVHLDHRLDGAEPIQDKPCRWMSNHPCNLDNQDLFLKCKFGVLCHQCNIHLPTMNRKQWIANVTRYIMETEQS